MVLGVVAAGAYLAHKAMHPTTPQTESAAPASTAISAASEQIQHPIEQAQAGPVAASTAALPALDNSDASVAAALAVLAGGGDLSSLLVRQQIIARIVATIDALPRRGLSTYMLPVHPPKGAVITQDSNGTTVIGAQNASRYAPYMRIIEGADPQALVAWYVHTYPLFQEAYRQLGYPKGYFNDRLIVVIDDMLTAPEPTQSPTLVHSKAYYVYADPTLESLSAGQKLLLRVGPANEAKIKAQLRAIRARLIGQTLPSASASTE
ncbi:hypothetical protein GCM10008098_07620 [Rhodanobacter panaciterrae]|uniref:DUF3014 domain-containing protein n=1 Tax=Rhodanobacter panaciterrae TaxID=490572 RepID=A0ABQ2ZK02_9GAMM|nr:hypothetical protein GCM10008098_07620 [Rhodanobacter panaciterrae]